MIARGIEVKLIRLVFLILEAKFGDNPKNLDFFCISISKGGKGIQNLVQFKIHGI